MKRTMGLIMGTVLAVSTVGMAMSVSAAEPANENLFHDKMGITKAVEIALQDAGLTEDQVEFSKKVNEFSDGQYYYDIHFMTRGDSKYEYEVDAFTGDILERDQEPWEADDDMEYQGLADAGQEFFATEDEAILKVLEEAFEAAMKESGAEEADVITYKYGVSYDDGKVVLDVGFIVPGGMEYDYDIELGTGMITDMDQDIWNAEDDAEYHNLLTPPAKEAAAQPAQGAIDDEAAKQIALKDAGLAETDVQMIKCQKDFDDGVEKYDVDFYGPDGMKYEYDIRVSDGVIIDKDAEFDD